MSDDNSAEAKCDFVVWFWLSFSQRLFLHRKQFLELKEFSDTCAFEQLVMLDDDQLNAIAGTRGNAALQLHVMRILLGSCLSGLSAL